MTNEEIKNCLAKIAVGKMSDVMSFDYAGAFDYICNLERQNLKMKDYLKNIVDKFDAYFNAKSELLKAKSEIYNYIAYELKEEEEDKEL